VSAAAPAARLEPRRGVARWTDGFAAMVRWHFASLRLWMPVAMAVEILAGVGMVLAVGLLVPHVSARAALYATTGSAVVTMVLIGLILGPQLVAQQKTDHTYEYLLTLAVPRSAAALAWCVVTAAISLPAAAVTVLTGVLRYHLTLSASPQVAVAVPLGIFTMTMLGYALAHAIGRPMVTILLSQILIFFAFGYAPVNFPASQMPHWLVAINRGLPFLPMATAVRDGLVRGLASDLAASYAALAAWAVASICLALFAMERRR